MFFFYIYLFYIMQGFDAFIVDAIKLSIITFIFIALVYILDKIFSFS
jgi:hypothetical protein